MTPAERDAQIHAADQARRDAAQAEADRIAENERRAREKAQADRVEAARILAELTPKLVGIVGDLVRLEQLRGAFSLVDAIRDSLRDAGVDYTRWRALGVLGDVGRPQPAQLWPKYQLG
jgi:hypothetical protein